MAFQVDGPFLEFDTLADEPAPLLSCRAAQRYGAIAADHAPPGNCLSVGEGVEGPTDGTRAVAEAGESGDVAVGRDPPARDATHKRVNPREERVGARD